MENFKEKIIIANNEPDFINNDESVFSASYIILCKNDSVEDEAILKTSVCGVSLPEWTAMACESKPIFLSIRGDENILELVRPYVGASEYIVVLYANTPLLTKTHLKDLICFAARKRFNVCKLKKGFILRSDFVLEADNIYSNFAYDLESNDFFEVNNIVDIENVKITLEKRVLAHHLKNCVIFDSNSNVNLDASVKIGKKSRISSFVTISENSTIGEQSHIEPNTVIINSKIGDNCKIGAGSVIKNSIVKNNTEIGASANIIHSVVGEEVSVGNVVKIVDSAIGEGSVINDFATLDSANVNKKATVGKFACIAGVGLSVVVDENALIPAFSKIVKFDK